MKLALIFLMALLAGCDAPPPTQSVDSIKIRWVRMASADLWKQCGIGRDGCSIRYHDVCVIYAQDPLKIGKSTDLHELTRYGILGHETKHCFDGMFHD